AAVREMEKGLFDANLGGNVYKKRIAIGNKGKSAGSRTIIATNMDDRWFFLFCYLKKDMANISEDDLEDFKELARILLGLSEEQILCAVAGQKMEAINESKE
ncbi:MAG: type II toxin-antitoxin system RelE/ParE family toxin, partial [Mailhella sp.]|nr:type II toxin-antitoxin system RelE/ParE family toxin [Mailhella sp.]